MREGGGVWDASPPLRVLCGRENIYADFTGGGGAFLNGGAELSIIQGCLLNPPPLLFFLRRVQRWGRPRVSPHAHMGVFPPALHVCSVYSGGDFSSPLPPLFLFFSSGVMPQKLIYLSLQDEMGGGGGGHQIFSPPPLPRRPPRCARKGLHGSTTMAKEKEKPSFGFLPFLLRGLFLFYFPLLSSPGLSHESSAFGGLGLVLPHFRSSPFF